MHALIRPKLLRPKQQPAAAAGHAAVVGDELAKVAVGEAPALRLKQLGGAALLLKRGPGKQAKKKVVFRRALPKGTVTQCDKGQPAEKQVGLKAEVGARGRRGGRKPGT